MKERKLTISNVIGNQFKVEFKNKIVIKPGINIFTEEK